MALKTETWTEMRPQVNDKTGEYIDGSKYVPSEFTTVKATGKDVGALFGAMKESSQKTLQQAWNLDQSVGVVDLPDRDGKLVRIRANQYDQYRAMGYGMKSTKTSFSVQGFGRMQRENVLKQKITYSGNSKRIWTLFKDGTEETKEEVA